MDEIIEIQPQFIKKRETVESIDLRLQLGRLLTTISTHKITTNYLTQQKKRVTFLAAKNASAQPRNDTLYFHPQNYNKLLIWQKNVCLQCYSHLAYQCYSYIKKKRFNKLWLSIALKWLEFTESLLQNYNKLLIQQKNVCLQYYGKNSKRYGSFIKSTSRLPCPSKS